MLACFSCLPFNGSGAYTEPGFRATGHHGKHGSVRLQQELWNSAVVSFNPCSGSLKLVHAVDKQDRRRRLKTEHSIYQMRIFSPELS